MHVLLISAATQRCVAERNASQRHPTHSVARLAGRTAAERAHFHFPAARGHVGCTSARRRTEAMRPIDTRRRGHRVPGIKAHVAVRITSHSVFASSAPHARISTVSEPLSHSLSRSPLSLSAYLMLLSVCVFCVWAF